MSRHLKRAGSLRVENLTRQERDFLQSSVSLPAHTSEPDLHAFHALTSLTPTSSNIPVIECEISHDTAASTAPLFTPEDLYNIEMENLSEVESEAVSEAADETTSEIMSEVASETVPEETYESDAEIATHIVKLPVWKKMSQEDVRPAKEDVINDMIDDLNRGQCETENAAVLKRLEQEILALTRGRIMLSQDNARQEELRETFLGGNLGKQKTTEHENGLGGDSYGIHERQLSGGQRLSSEHAASTTTSDEDLLGQTATSTSSQQTSQASSSAASNSHLAVRPPRISSRTKEAMENHSKLASTLVTIKPEPQVSEASHDAPLPSTKHRIMLEARIQEAKRVYGVAKETGKKLATRPEGMSDENYRARLTLSNRSIESSKLNLRCCLQAWAMTVKSEREERREAKRAVERRAELKEAGGMNMAERMDKLREAEGKELEKMKKEGVTDESEEGAGKTAKHQDKRIQALIEKVQSMVNTPWVESGGPAGSSS